MPIILKRWTPLFDADSERLDTISVWVCLLGLPWDFWNPYWPRDLGNTMGVFLEVDLSFVKTRCQTIAIIIVSLNIRTDLREHINLIWGSKIRKQIMYYEGLPFRCHHYHDMGHLERNCNLGPPPTSKRKRWLSKETVVQET